MNFRRSALVATLSVVALTAAACGGDDSEDTATDAGRGRDEWPRRTEGDPMSTAPTTDHDCPP